MVLSDNIWWTRKAQIQSEKRLLSYEFHSQVLLLWYSFFSVAVSIYYLNHDNDDTSNNLAETSWVVYAVLVLVISGFIKGLSFKERAAQIKKSYVALNSPYLRAKKEEQSDDLSTKEKEYEQILSVCENHTDVDYYQALCEAYLTHSKATKGNLTRHPTWYHWWRVGWVKFTRFIMLSLFYLLPIIMFYALRKLV